MEGCKFSVQKINTSQILKFYKKYFSNATSTLCSMSLYARTSAAHSLCGVFFTLKVRTSDVIENQFDSEWLIIMLTIEVEAALGIQFLEVLSENEMAKFQSFLKSQLLYVSS